ncbi:MAG: rhodanese-like domain-containing protein [Desulfurivibrio sp.]|nr:rhodanese-like domain-containing protein [Desulfurivibrio sp.]
MVEGITTWRNGINPVLTSPAWLKMAQETGAPHILVDVRRASEARKAHIPGALNYPVTEMEKLDAALEKAGNNKKQTKIIFYSYGDREATTAHRIMRANGWEKARILDGGIHDWGMEGYATAQNQLARKVPTFKWQPPAGAIYRQKFEKLAADTPADTVILDVRSPKEYMASMVPGALTIPIDTLKNRLNEVPRDKKIVTMCKAGNRAWMAYRLLTENGFDNVQFVIGHISNFSDGVLQKGAYQQQ